MRAFDRVNLCRQKWTLKEARAKATEIAFGAETHRVVVLCGQKVTSVFGFEYEPLTSVGPAGELVPRFLILPHPSGLCRFWREPGAYGRARAFLREHGVLPHDTVVRTLRPPDGADCPEVDEEDPVPTYTEMYL